MNHRKPHLILFMALGLLMGCSPKTSYEVLSFFFDGVRDPSRETAITVTDTAKTDPQALTLADRASAGPVLNIHPPYQQHKCSGCHDKETRVGLILPQPELCYECHYNYADEYAYQHGPVAGGYCTACHAPHSSELPKLMKKQGQELCLECHSLAEVMKNETHADIGTSDCIECHNPHGGPNRFILK